MKTIHVLGLGPSLKEFVPDGNITIGVNDIYRYHAADYVLCIDPVVVFSRDRVNGIISGTQKKFFTNRKGWLPLVKNYEHIKTMSIGECKEGMPELKQNLIHSTNSTFVAACMAYRMGANRIILHGVDLTSHPKLGRAGNLNRTINDFVKLGKGLNYLDVQLIVSSRQSILSNYLPVLGK